MISRIFAFGLGVAAFTVAHAGTIVVPATSIHICVNIHDQDGPRAIAAMKQEGFGCYRKDATGGAIETQLAAAGLKGDFIVTDGPLPTGQASKISKLALAYPGSVEFVESRNEVNNRATVFGGFTDTVGGNQSKRTAIVLYDGALMATLHNDPHLAGVPMLAHTDIHATAGPADWANAHAYDPNNGWGGPSYWVPQVAKEMSTAMPGKPQAITEFGATGAPQSYLFPAWIAAALQAGVDRVWLYELRDAPGDPFGLFNADWTPKPAAAVLAKLNAVLSDTGPAVAAKPLRVAISDPAINSVLIPKSDGSYVHLLWRSWPDGKVHPFTWSYDRPVTVAAEMYAHSAATSIWRARSWSKNAGEPSDWNTYVDGVLVVVVRP